MAKRTGKRAASPVLFIDAARRRHRHLFLPKLLQEMSARPAIDGQDLEKARMLLNQWADLAEAGHLNQKETSLDAEFLEKIFGDALGYKSVTESPNDYHREKQFAVPGAGTADGALGSFVSGKNVAPTAIIELKGADTDLDHDKFKGRTPVQQCWDYLNQLPSTPWGIVSNYVTIRLYHRDSPARAYEEFTVKDFRDPDRVRQFFYVFHRYGLLGNKFSGPRAIELLKNSQNRLREVGDELYRVYSDQRQALIAHLIAEHGKSQDQAIHIAQRIIDRIVFVAFCQTRGLLPERLIQSAYKEVPRYTSVVNPRWQQFKTVFRFIDRGNDDQGIDRFNGNLFKPDAEVDNLELGDEWTHFFKQIGDYDFKDEVNVDILGHLFERSVTELEKLRVVGLFGKQAEQTSAMMPKSAERKRFGIYYTPPEFTRLIVEQTIGKLIEERVDPIEDFAGKIAELRKIKVCDPACGSGAFLIAAYDRFEEAYEDVARLMRIQANAKNDLPLSVRAEKLVIDYPDYVLSDNLYGVDLSAQSVEITQLALWIRSARKGRTLTDLSKNVVNGNSLIRDPSVHPKALNWQQAFPEAFDRPAKGFDAVIGNPPWERMKMQEREFFSFAAPEIATAVNAADRRKLIAAVEQNRPELWERYKLAQDNAERILAHVRTEAAGFPLTGKGDVNTYMLFAELARRIVSPSGRVGLLVPSGIATDDTTKEFFNDLMDSTNLIALYDFENRKLIFPDVDGRFKFSVLLVGGAETKCDAADFVFFAHEIKDLDVPTRHIPLSNKDLKLLNPNTKTCPVFRSRRDAEITRGVYRRVPILIDENRRADGNPWGIRFCRMFDQTNDAGSFLTGETLKADGFKLEGNRWVKRRNAYLPLYEAKMIQAFDHRAAGVRIEAGNWMRQGQTEETNVVEHHNPEFVVQPRYWVASDAVTQFIGRRPGVLAYKDVTSATNQRTMISAMVPPIGLMNSAPFILTSDGIPIRRELCLLANLNSLAYDFVARQKVGGLHLNFFIVEQIPTLPPDRYDEKCPWSKRTKLEDWIAERVLKLTCTSEDMIPLAEAAGFEEKIHKWKDDERAKLRAELDAAYFYLYGIGRDDVDYILTTFQGITDEDQAHGGRGPTRTAIFDALDALDPTSGKGT
jgi:hypothetical protein